MEKNIPNINVNIKNSVADTLFIPLYAKAVETNQKDPLIIDKTACDLVDKIDYDFAKYKNKKASSVGSAIRANYFDEIARDFIASHDNPVIVLVGCGLDARVIRIGEAASKAIFYEIDLPEVINMREKLIPPKDNEKLIAASMFETKWQDNLVGKYGGQDHDFSNFLFIVEGVLMYFDEAQNKIFFNELAERFKEATLYFDALNRFMASRSDIHDTVSKTNAIFRFGVDNDKEIETWNPHLKHNGTRLFNSFHGYKRMGFPLAFLMNTVKTFKTSCRLLSYKIV